MFKLVGIRMSYGIIKRSRINQLRFFRVGRRGIWYGVVTEVLDIGIAVVARIRSHQGVPCPVGFALFNHGQEHGLLRA